MTPAQVLLTAAIAVAVGFWVGFDLGYTLGHDAGKPCALSVANQLCLATKGAQRGTKVFRVGAPPQTPDHDAGKRGAK